MGHVKADPEIEFDDALLGGESRVIFLAVIRRAWQDAGLPDASGLLDRYGLSRADEVEALHWLTDRTGHHARAREEICDLADVDSDYLREHAVKALGGENTIAARLAPGAAMLTTAEILQRKRDVTSQLPSAAQRQRDYMRRYRQQRIAAGLPVRPRAEIAASLLKDRDGPLAAAMASELAKAQPVQGDAQTSVRGQF